MSIINWRSQHEGAVLSASWNFLKSSVYPQTSKDDLLQTDFEGALKFFRVPVPKRYRSEENAKKLMELACSMKVTACVQAVYLVQTKMSVEYLMWWSGHFITEKGIVHSEMKICWKFTHSQAIQDVDYLLLCRWCFFIRTDLEKFSIASLAHQWILCSEWVPSEWESKQLIKISGDVKKQMSLK